MDLITLEENESIVINPSWYKHDVLRVVVTEGTTEIALALMYRIFSDIVFGSDKSIFLSIFERQEKAMFLKSVEIELTAFCPNLLDEISCTDDPSIAFKSADIVFSIGKARGYEFSNKEYSDTFFQESVLLAKFHGEMIEKYAKKSVKVITLENTTATVISHYASSVPKQNITSLTMFNMKISKAYIATQASCRPDEIKNIIIWGSNNNCVFPDCRYICFNNNKIIKDDLHVWLRTELPNIIQNMPNRSWYTRSLAYALADHCKILWNGTPKDEWTCMGVSSDNSYGVQIGIYFSYPVFCENGEYKIVKGLLDNNQYIKKQIKDLSDKIMMEARAAFKICNSK